MTQGAACEPKWKTLLIFLGSVLSVCLFLWGGGVLSGMTGGDGKMKRKREGGFPTDGLLQFDFTVKYFPGIIVGEKNVIEVY